MHESITFVPLEAGTSTHIAAFVKNHLNRQPTEASELQVNLAEMPTLAHLEKAIRNTHAFRATGPDGLPNELFRAEPAVLPESSGLWQ